jgi:outer membrane protein TolC
MKRRYCVLLFIVLLNQSLQAQRQIPLEEVVAMAVERSYDVQLSKNTLESSLANEKLITGAFLPQVTLNGSKTWNNNDQKQRLADNSEREQNGIRSNNLSASAQATWTIFDGTKMFTARRRILETTEQSELALKDQMTNTVADVINNYYDIVQQKQQLKALQEQMSVSEERVKLAERKLQVGTGAKPELLQARVDLNAQRTLALQQETAIDQLKEQLNAQVGGQLPVPYDVADTIVINLGLKEEEVMSNIENTNFTLQVARKNIEIADLALRESRADRFPVVNLFGNYNFSRQENKLVINNFTPLFNQNKGFNYGVTVTLPLIRSFNYRRNIRQASIESNRQQLLFHQQKVLVDAGVKSAYVNYTNAREVLLIEEENILLAKENVSIALETFKRGATTYVELRTAQQSLAEAYTRLITARYLAKSAEIELLRLNGSLLK